MKQRQRLQRTLPAVKRRIQYWLREWAMTPASEAAFTALENLCNEIQAAQEARDTELLWALSYHITQLYQHTGQLRDVAGDIAVTTEQQERDA